MSQLIVGFYDSIFNDKENNEFLNYILAKGFIGIDEQRITGSENSEGIKSLSVTEIEELYKNKQLIHDDLGNIKKYFKEPEFSYIRSSYCIGLYTNDIDDLIGLLLPNGNIDLYGVVESELPIIIQKSAYYFEKIQITFLNDFTDNNDPEIRADFAVNLYNKLVS
jgi:hypothetical protein